MNPHRPLPPRRTIEKQPGGRGTGRWHYSVEWNVAPDVWIGLGGWASTKSTAKYMADLTYVEMGGTMGTPLVIEALIDAV